MAALILSLQLTSAKASFDALSEEVIQMSGDAMLLDRTLARYGPEAQPIREMIKVAAGRALYRARLAVRTNVPCDMTNNFDMAIFDLFQTLSPKTEAQQVLKSHAIETAFTITSARK